MARIFLAGASRGVGREVARQLIINGHQVSALLRSDNAKDDLTAMKVDVVRGDALNEELMGQLIGQISPDAVISTIGGLPSDTGVRVDFLGNKHLVDAAVAAQAKRFILVTSIGIGDSAQALPPQALETLAPVLAEKEKAEAHLAKSGLTYTVIRPGGLVSQPATDQEVLTENTSVAGSIHRMGVAKLLVSCMEGGRAED